jgi:hypothetical protein
MPYADLDPVDGIYSPAMSINRIMRGFRHQFIYNHATLAAMLGSVGFSDIKKRSFGEGAEPALLLDSVDRAVESLYVEAQKPDYHQPFPGSLRVGLYGVSSRFVFHGPVAELVDAPDLKSVVPKGT